MSNALHTATYDLFFVTTQRIAMNLWLNYAQQDSEPTPEQWQQFKVACANIFTCPWIINPANKFCSYVVIDTEPKTYIANPSLAAYEMQDDLRTALDMDDLALFDELFQTATL